MEDNKKNQGQRNQGGSQGLRETAYGKESGQSGQSQSDQGQYGTQGEMGQDQTGRNRNERTPQDNERDVEKAANSKKSGSSNNNR